jgi:mono/diheme cytochrome c family protein
MIRIILPIIILGCSQGQEATAVGPTKTVADQKTVTEQKTVADPKTATEQKANAAEPGSSKGGEAVYATYCKSCHQADGKAMGGMLGADFTNPERMNKSDEEFLNSIKNGFKGKRGQMPPWGKVLSEQEMKDVLAYIRETFK